MSQQPMSRRARLIVLAAVLCLDLLCAGLAAAVLTLFGIYFPLLGVVLIGQILFFMMLILAFMRQIPLDANHPAFQDGAPASVVIARMEQTRLRLLTIEPIGGGVILLLGLILAVFSAMSWHFLPLVGTIIMLPLGFTLIAHSFTLFHRRSEHEYARLAGMPATARVVNVARTGWGVPSRSFDRARIYVLDIEVMPPSGAPYRVTLHQPIRSHPSNMPPVGAMIPVKYLPDQPQVVIAMLEPEDAVA